MFQTFGPEGPPGAKETHAVRLYEAELESGFHFSLCSPCLRGESVFLVPGVSGTDNVDRVDPVDK
jgi:hypothetical protein